MKKILFLLLCNAMLLIGYAQHGYAQHGIIPVPVSYEANNTEFSLTNQLELSVQSKDAEVGKYAQQLASFLNQKGITTAISDLKKSTGAFSISLNKKSNDALGDEGYSLSINKEGILLSANKAAGIFNGIQTFKQLLPTDFAAESFQLQQPVQLKGCEVTDYPRFPWRGLMLDVSRHFFSVDEVKAYIDKMAAYKFNVFHWHLTDDEGWRIEIKSLPKLTEVGAWRVNRFGRFGDTRPYPKEGEKATYGGFYTQEQIKEVIQYAADRNVTIVPEIDIPGHSMAALAAYPELSTKKEPKFVNPGSKFAEWYGGGKFEMLIENTLNPADEKVYEFVDKVFTEVADLFPGEYIHMGGDECYHGYWDKDLEVQAFMKKNDIKDSHSLQSYFVARVEKIISSKGKKMIGWDEILEGEPLPKNAAVMSWRGMKGGIEAAKKGHKVVMSPTTFAYLDYTQGDPSEENKIYASLSLEESYTFEPVPEGVDANLILGGQGNLWTEVVPSLPYAYYMTYPRAFAIAETLWSKKENKNWESFINRTEAHFIRFEAANENIAQAVYEPAISVSKKGDKLICQLENSVPNTEIYYSIDNTYPVKFAQKYTGEFEVPEGNLSLRTQTYRNGKPIGRELKIHRNDLIKRAEQ